MLSAEHVASLRRSYAMAPLGRHHDDELLAAYVHERRQLVNILEELRTTFPRVREIVARMSRLDVIGP